METIVLIGASTGGPGHLKKILSSLKGDTKASFVIAQHMNKDVMESFVSQLSESSKLPVVLVKNNKKISQSYVYICSNSLKFSIKNFNIYLDETTLEDIYTPSINILFDSACKLLPKYKIISILLTGIGDDGAASMHSLYKNGAYCISECQKSAIVFGMPKQAYIANNEISVMCLNQIIKFLKDV